MSAIDLTNQRFGRLVAVSSEGIRVRQKRIIQWRCVCDCGQVTRVRTGNLKTGSTKSCGCLQRERRNETDLTGRRFGNIIALARLPTKNGRGNWLCVCDCGAQIPRLANSLVSGHTRSCGQCGIFKIYIKPGDTFGRLTVKEEVEPPANRQGRHWRCACECGGFSIVRAKDLPNGNTVSCGCRKIETAGMIQRMHGRGGSPFRTPKAQRGGSNIGGAR